MRKAILLSAIFFLTLLFSCKKDGELSPDFDSGNLSINFTDTFSLQTKVLEEDSLRTDLSIYNLLGLYNDPIFGPVSSSIYTQVLLTGANLDFGSAPILDSVVLTLDYVELYGDTASTMTINVYKLLSDLSDNTDYYSNSYVAHEVLPLASLTFTPNLSDSVPTLYNNTTYKPHLRIKLPNTFGIDILNNSPFTSSTDFLSFLKGFYITTQDSVTNTSISPGSGSIVSFNLNSSLSTLSIYYHYNESEKAIIPLKYDFSISTDGVKYSRFAHNYAGTDVLKHITNNPTKDTTVTYVSTMAGVKTKIEMPTIKDLSKFGNIVINKAELVFTIESNSEGNFDEAISSLSLVGINSAGETVVLSDYSEILGGSSKEPLVDEGTSKTYSFKLSRHIQQLLFHSTTDYGLYLLATGGSTTAKRSVISSEKNLISKIRLNITYSKL